MSTLLYLGSMATVPGHNQMHVQAYVILGDGREMVLHITAIQVGMLNT